ncbi:DNA alkylation repair protein [Spirochaeta dissipatitropha]
MNTESDKTIEQKVIEIRSFFEDNADPAIVAKYSRYFKEGYIGYGINQKVFESQRDIWFKEWNTFTIDDYLDLGDQLITSGNLEDISIAIAFISLRRDQFSIAVFNHMEKWLESFTNWANTDVLCMLVLSFFITDKIIEPDNFLQWTTSQSKWTRRAVPVTFFEAVKNGEDPVQYFSIIEPIMLDTEEDVQKGLGTFLRESWKKCPESTEEFLLEWKDSCGRKIIQYATEKMDKEHRKYFSRKK